MGVNGHRGSRASPLVCRRASRSPSTNMHWGSSRAGVQRQAVGSSVLSGIRQCFLKSATLLCTACAPLGREAEWFQGIYSSINSGRREGRGHSAKNTGFLAAKIQIQSRLQAGTLISHRALPGSESTNHWCAERNPGLTSLGCCQVSCRKHTLGCLVHTPISCMLIINQPFTLLHVPW